MLFSCINLRTSSSAGQSSRLITDRSRVRVPGGPVEGSDTMPIYKRCSKCGKRIPSGTTCECIKQIRRQQKKERDKDYDQHRRNKTRAAFYKTKAWRLTKEDVLTHYMYIDLYAYYHDGKFIQATMVHHIVPISTDYTFQSTLPAGGATRFLTSWGYSPNISIHAPRGGSDVRGGVSALGLTVFQSTLPAGGSDW